MKCVRFMPFQGSTGELLELHIARPLKNQSKSRSGYTTAERRWRPGARKCRDQYILNPLAVQPGKGTGTETGARLRHQMGELHVSRIHNDPQVSASFCETYARVRTETDRLRGVALPAYAARLPRTVPPEVPLRPHPLCRIAAPATG